MIIHFASYDIEIAEMIMIHRCIKDNPNLNAREIWSLLGISKSNYYRKIKMFTSEQFIMKLLNHGYTSEQIKTLTSTLVL